jgi:hypothetical protein
MQAHIGGEDDLFPGLKYINHHYMVDSTLLHKRKKGKYFFLNVKDKHT